MKRNAASITRSDLVDLLGKINASLDRRDKRSDLRFKTLEASQKEIIRRLDRMEKRNGHIRIQIKKAGKNLIEI